MIVEQVDLGWNLLSLVISEAEISWYLDSVLKLVEFERYHPGPSDPRPHSFWAAKIRAAFRRPGFSGLNPKNADDSRLARHAHAMELANVSPDSGFLGGEQICGRSSKLLDLWCWENL